jgi:Contractile injection system tape measure protein
LHPHTITRQVFDLHCADAHRGQSLLQLVEADYETKILPVIERVLDSFAVAGYEIEIDRLEIDLGDVPDGSFAQALPQLVERALHRQLQALLTNPETSLVRRKPTAQGEWEALTAFLATGLAPGWMEEKAFQPWELLLIALKEAPQRLRAFLLGLQAGDRGTLEAMLQRMAGAPDPRIMPAILQAWLGEATAQAMLEIWALVAGVAKDIGAGSAVIWQLRTALLAAASAAPEADERMFILWEAESASPAVWADLVAQASAKFTAAPTETVPVRKRWHDWLATKVEAAAKLPQATLPLMHPPKRPPASAAPQDRIYVAGFLPAHFAHLELLDHLGQFYDPNAQMQALRHLEVLASGLHPPEEHGLALSKLLCGLDLAAPVDLTQLPSEADLATADGLLQAVITYWPIVGDITPDQLRGGFLLRDGWLQPGQTDLTLRVERKAYDVVLEQLPWAIGVVSLPWMTGKIWVEW